MAPHQGRPGVPVGAPNAALLIDFDNVTMGIRSDLTKQLKDLLNSDIIKGKVAVQRAYADWRRYAQYIVPLSEASVDLIFAPAYGSSKKNATDIRLAIDALELVFTRPEIGVFILLSGDSDFSSLVLKLKEYGKYVVGVGLRESASDLLVQNCDEYFSYSALTGLTKAGEEDVVASVGPWELAERAVRQMADENDVMRSDRLKQVMLEMDPSFDESTLGFSKFNRFITEAASKNKLALRKLDNGQYEVQPYLESSADTRESRRGGRGGRGRGREERPSQERGQPRAPEPMSSTRAPEPPRREAAQAPVPKPATRERKVEDLQAGYELLQRAVKALLEDGGAARDSDIKRQMMELQSGWDESELGFTKFSRFLRQAHDAKVIDLQKSGEGYYQATLPGGAGQPRRDQERDRDRGRDQGREQARERPRDRGRDRSGEPGRSRAQADSKPSEMAASGSEATTPSEPEPESRRSRQAESRRQEQRQQREESAAAEAAAEETAVASSGAEAGSGADRGGRGTRAEAKAERRPEPEQSKREPEATEPAAEQERKPSGGAAAKPVTRSMGGRGRGRRGAAEGPPPLLPGQVVGSSSGGGKPGEAERAPAGRQATPASSDEEQPEASPAAEQPAERGAERGAERAAGSAATSEDRVPTGEPATLDPGAAPSAQPAGQAAAAKGRESQAELAFGDEAPFDADELGLPTEQGAVIRYLSNSYPGVGQKTAEALIEAFGAEHVFHGLHTRPDRIREMLGAGRRTDQLLEAWNRDFRRRSSAGAGTGADATEATA